LVAVRIDLEAAKTETREARNEVEDLRAEGQPPAKGRAGWPGSGRRGGRAFVTPNWLPVILVVAGVIVLAMLAYSILGWTGMR
jgi:hypothetical protein